VSEFVNLVHVRQGVLMMRHVKMILQVMCARQADEFNAPLMMIASVVQRAALIRRVVSRIRAWTVESVVILASV